MLSPVGACNATAPSSTTGPPDAPRPHHGSVAPGGDRLRWRGECNLASAGSTVPNLRALRCRCRGRSGGNSLCFRPSAERLTPLAPWTPTLGRTGPNCRPGKGASRRGRRCMPRRARRATVSEASVASLRIPPWWLGTLSAEGFRFADDPKLVKTIGNYWPVRDDDLRLREAGDLRQPRGR